MQQKNNSDVFLYIFSTLDICQHVQHDMVQGCNFTYNLKGFRKICLLHLGIRFQSKGFRAYLFRLSRLFSAIQKVPSVFVSAVWAAHLICRMSWTANSLDRDNLCEQRKQIGCFFILSKHVLQWAYSFCWQWSLECVWDILLSLYWYIDCFQIKNIFKNEASELHFC